MADAIKELIKLIETSVTDFEKSLPGVQDKMFDSILELSKEFTIPARTAKQQVANLKIIQRLKEKIKVIVLNPDYKAQVKDFVSKFSEVQQLQNKYFNSITENFTTKTLYDTIKLSYIDYTIEALTDAGVVNVSSQIKKLLLQNITSGASYSKLVKEMRTYLEGKDGALVKYARQITTDSLNQYSASYTKAVTQDLGLVWYRYVGSLIKTSRPFCKALVEKDYVHQSELPEVAAGIINGHQVSTAGMIEGTNESTFMVYRGGYNCGHQLYPVSEFSVPIEIRNKFS